MTPDRKTPPGGPPDVLDESGEPVPPASEEERRHADALRAALERAGAHAAGGAESPDALPPESPARAAFELAASLRAARAPTDLADDVAERIASQALGSGAATEPPATAEEVAAASALATQLDALLAGKKHASGNDGGAMAEALRAADAPRTLDQLTHERILRKALGSAAQPGQASQDQAQQDLAGQGQAHQAVAPRRWVSRAVGTLAVAAAAAAAAWLAVAPSAEHMSPEVLGASLVSSRSTTELFDATEPFPQTGGTSERVDKIARVRASELRSNRFTAWGVE